MILMKVCRIANKWNPLKGDSYLPFKDEGDAVYLVVLNLDIPFAFECGHKYCKTDAIYYETDLNQS